MVIISLRNWYIRLYICFRDKYDPVVFLTTIWSIIAISPEQKRISKYQLHIRGEKNDPNTPKKEVGHN